MRILKFLAILVAVAGVAALALVYAPAVEGQRAGNRDFMILRGPGSAIGATVRDTASGDKTAGVVVEDVREGSAAEKAGLKRGDIIVEFDGERVRSARQFTRLVSETPPDRTVKATIVRDGRRTDVQLTPSDRASTYFDADRLRDRLGDLEGLADRIPFDFNFDLDLPSMRGRLGVTVQELTPQLDTYFGAKGGVLVTSVAEGSAAEKAGLRAGDVITSVNGTAIHARNELTRSLREADGEATIAIVRDKKEMTLKAKIEPRSRTTRNVRPM
jgi:serine protease Do